ncbi:hypothetical protein ACHAXT_007760 [Thalassiosira profunda]
MKQPNGTNGVHHTNGVHRTNGQNGNGVHSPEPTRARSRSRIANLLATAIVTGMLCYRLGKFAGCASPWLEGIAEAEQQSTDASFWGVSDDHDAPSSLSSDEREPDSQEYEDRRFVPRPNAPYDCGVIFFYHIPTTGGASINAWFRKYKKPEFGSIKYYQWWELAVRKDGSYHPNPEHCEEKFYRGMEEHISDLGPNEWRIAHSHVTSQYLNESEDVLYKWRSTVEAQGCQLINSIMLRDPLSHTMSLHKIVGAKNSTWDEWLTHLATPSDPGRWATVLDFFLYNNHGLRYHDDYPNGPGGRNPYNVTKKEKVRRAMELLHRHFDVVTVSDHATFMGKILNWTGLTPMKMPYTNALKRELTFTKKEVETMQKLLRNNGDLDFVDQVKLDYHDHLAYLD